jgi:hypothetical protein
MLWCDEYEPIPPDINKKESNVISKACNDYKQRILTYFVKVSPPEDVQKIYRCNLPKYFEGFTASGPRCNGELKTKDVFKPINVIWSHMKRKHRDIHLLKSINGGFMGTLHRAFRYVDFLKSTNIYS